MTLETLVRSAVAVIDVLTCEPCAFGVSFCEVKERYGPCRIGVGFVARVCINCPSVPPSPLRAPKQLYLNYTELH